MSSDKAESGNNFALWILCGVGIELFLLMPALVALYNWIQPYPICPSPQYHPEWGCPPQPPSFPTYVLLLPFLALYLVIPVLYCTYASCKQTPKRIVPPHQMAFWTIVIAGIVVETMLPTSPRFTYYDTAEWLLILGVFAAGWLATLAIITGVLGYVQTLAVRTLVGFNDGPVYHITHRVNVDSTRVREAVLKPAFLRDWRFKQIPHEPASELVLKSRVYYHGARTDNLIIIAPSEGNQTLIHGTAFVEDFYEIRDGDAPGRLGHILNDIAGDLGVSKGDTLVDPHLKSVAQEFVNQHTRTKFTVARGKLRRWLATYGQMDRQYRNLIGFTIAGLLLTNAAIVLWSFSSAQFDFELALIDANVPFFIALVIELGVPAIRSIGGKLE